MNSIMIKYIYIVCIVVLSSCNSYEKLFQVEKNITLIDQVETNNITCFAISEDDGSKTILKFFKGDKELKKMVFDGQLVKTKIIDRQFCGILRKSESDLQFITVDYMEEYSMNLYPINLKLNPETFIDIEKENGLLLMSQSTSDSLFIKVNNYVVSNTLDTVYYEKSVLASHYSQSTVYHLNKDDDEIITLTSKSSNNETEELFSFKSSMCEFSAKIEEDQNNIYVIFNSSISSDGEIWKVSKEYNNVEYLKVFFPVIDIAQIKGKYYITYISNLKSNQFGTIIPEVSWFSDRKWITYKTMENKPDK